MFADLVSSTETVAQLGPEAGEAWRQRFVGVMREALAASRGREVQHTGDGLFAAFESASDAVACAAGIQQRTLRASERRDAGAPTEVRVGVAVGEAREDAEGVHGLVVVEASRLCAAAKPGQILTTALAEVLAAGGPHRFAPVGELTLKGLSAPVAAREVAWEKPAASVPLSARLAEPERGSFVGRAAERARLDAALEATRRGERRIALLAGEPGIGKTRLASELARDAHAAGAVVLDGRCDEDLGAPFQPWVQALTHLAAHLPADELRALLGDDVLAAARVVPELRRRLPELPAPPAADPGAERWQLFEALDALLAAASRAAPIVVLLDDLHWADSASLALLRHLARSTRAAALLILGTYHETDLARTHPLAALLADLHRERSALRVLLRGLALPELGALVAARAQHAAPEVFVRTLHTETEGNPFFAVEVIRHLVEAGELRQDEGGRWAGDRPIAEMGIPEGVRDVVGRRLSRLSETANEALRAASVVGREFEAAVLEAASGIAREALLDALDESTRARIVAPVPEAAGRWMFAHALIRQTLYEELGSAQRMRLHWRVGEALERRHARELDAHAVAIAHHLAEGVLAGDPLRSSDASLRAAERAASLAAHEEARAHFERALATLDQAGLDEPERRYRAWMGVGAALFSLADAAHRDAYLDASRIAQAEGWSERMARAVLGASQHVLSEPDASQQLLAPIEAALAALGPDDRPERAALLVRRAFVANFQDAGFDQMEPALREADEMGRRIGDVGTVGLGTAGSFVIFGHANVDKVEKAAREQLDAAILRQDALQEGWARQSWIGIALARGDRRIFDTRIGEFEHLLNRTGSRFHTQWLILIRGTLALAEGRFADARRYAAEARDSVVGHASSALMYRAQVQMARLEQGRHAQIAELLAGFLTDAPRWLQYQRTIRATALAELGRRGEAQRELDAFEALALPRYGYSWRFTLRYLAESAALLADRDRAAVVAPLLEPYVGQLLATYQYFALEGSADRARGQVAATLGKLDEAISHYESGLALEESFGAPALAARTRYWLARALATRANPGDAARAHVEAEAAHAAAHGFGMVLLSGQAAALAAQLS